MRKLFYLLMALLWAVPAFAVDDVIYCRCGCANNGDGTADSCAASGGGVGGFNSWTNCIDGLEASTVAAGTNTITVRVNDEAGANCTMSSSNTIATVDTDYNEVIFAAASGAEHDGSGTIDSSLPVIETDTSAVYPIHIEQAIDITVRDLQFDISTSGAKASIWKSFNHTLNLTVERNIFVHSGSVNGNVANAIVHRTTGGSTKVANNIFRGFQDTGNLSAAIWVRQSGDIWFYNNTVHDNDNVITCQSTGFCANTVASNNIGQTLGSCFVDNDTLNASSDYNISENAQCSSPDDQGLGSNTVYSTVITFVDEAGGDWHINDADACVSNNLYSDSDLPITDDIDGDARPSSGDVLAGMDEDDGTLCGGGGGSIVPILMNYFRRRSIFGFFAPGGI